jgi:hypothetical protein
MKSHVLAAAAAFALASPAAAVVIDFEDQPNFSVVSGSIVYADATFTSSTGQFYINGAGVGKDLCTYNGSCDALLTVDFTTTANGLTFQTIGENAFGTLFVKIFQQGGAITDIELGYDGNFLTYDTHDLSAYADIVKLEMSSNDGAGVAYDNFSFTAGGTGGIPEPATWAMMIAGSGLVGAAARRRATTVHA